MLKHGREEEDGDGDNEGNPKSFLEVPVAVTFMLRMAGVGGMFFVMMMIVRVPGMVVAMFMHPVMFGVVVVPVMGIHD